MKKVAVVFSGYTSQYVGMGKDLYDEHRVVQEYFEEASNCLNVNLVKLAFASSDTELGRMENAYPVVLTYNVALCALLKNLGIEPAVGVGYNDGELAAYCAMGGYSFPDALYLINKYVSLYQSYVDELGVQVAHIQKVDRDSLIRMINDIVKKEDDALHISMYHTQDDHVVVGSVDAISLLHKLVEEKDGTIEYSNNAVGGHTSLFEECANTLATYLEKVDFKTMSIPVINAGDASLIYADHAIKTRVLDYVYNPLHWDEIIDRLRAYDIIITVGKDLQSTQYIQDTLSDIECISFATQDDIPKIERISELVQNNVN